MNQFVQRIPHRRLLAVILLVYLALTVAYSVVNPLFEAPDEQLHYFTAQYIAERGRLPHAGDPPDGWMGQEAAQPPLYYVLSAVLINPIDTSQAKEQVSFNPFTRLGDASSPTNTNHFVHTELEAWPWQGYVLAAHVLRLFSAVVGLGTLLFIYGSARQVWPEKHGRALLATALVAFLPQFNFLHASISNDPLVIFFCAAALWQLLQLWYDGISDRRQLLLGLTIGLAILSKTAGLLLLLYAPGFLAVLSWRQEKRIRPLLQTVARRIILVAVPALLVGGWLLLRNWQLYGDMTATSVFVRVAGGDRGYTLSQVLGETPGIWRSMFAVFGWMNVAPPSWLYYLWNGVVLLAVLGVIVSLVRAARRGRPPIISTNSILPRLLSPPFLLAVWVLVVYAGLAQFLLKTPAAQGRLMFPALVPMSLGMAYGLSRWRNRGVILAAPVLMLAASVFIMAFVIPEAYENPPSIEETAVSADAARIERDMGQGVRLVAALVETETAAQSEWVWLTLYWKGTAIPAGKRPVFVLELFGRNNDLLGKAQSYHGGGLFPADLWPENMVIEDRVAVRVDAAPDQPVQGRLNLKLEGETTSVDVGTVKILPASWPEAAGPPLAEVAGVALTSVEVNQTAVSPGDTIHLAVQWQVMQPPGRDLTTFVHLGQQSAPPLAQGDRPPLNGQYPTGLWAVGEIINDDYQLTIPDDLPDGRYPLFLGFYDPESGERPPLMVDGVQQPNSAYFVDWIEVAR